MLGSSLYSMFSTSSSDKLSCLAALRRASAVISLICSTVKSPTACGGSAGAGDSCCSCCGAAAFLYFANSSSNSRWRASAAFMRSLMPLNLPYGTDVPSSGSYSSVVVSVCSTSLLSLWWSAWASSACCSGFSAGSSCGSSSLNCSKTSASIPGISSLNIWKLKLNICDYSFTFYARRLNAPISSAARIRKAIMTTKLATPCKSQSLFQSV